MKNYDIVPVNYIIDNKVCLCPNCVVGYLIYPLHLKIDHRILDDLKKGYVKDLFIHYCDTCGIKLNVFGLFTEFDKTRYEKELLLIQLAEEKRKKSLIWKIQQIMQKHLMSFFQMKKN